VKRLAPCFAIVGLVCLAAIAGCSNQDLVPTRPWNLIRYDLVAAWGDSGSGNGQFFYPQGVAVDASGNVYVVDTANRRIQKFTRDGAYLTQWGTYGSGDGQFGYMNDIAVDPSGNVFVADAENGRVQKFTSDGVYQTQWASGSHTSEWGYHPDWQGLTVDAAGNVYVVHAIEDRPIQKFTADGDTLAQWGSEQRLFYAQSVAVDVEGNVYVPDGYFSVCKYSGSHALVARWPMRDKNHTGSERVAVDATGHIFVTDNHSHLIKKFTGTGRLLTQWDVGNTSWVPDIAVDPNGDVYVTDTVHNRILKFKPTLDTH